MKLSKEWWRTVRYAIEEDHRTIRLISILVTVGGVALVLIAATHGMSVTVG
ncbi:hypothetical protein ACPYPG_17570 [Streptomyces sp. FR-108]|uniref:hypothetical protein n=1 Tax=Streptomyces sp. FR-108 TaxID=3416665 RepID=UPI003CE73C0D